MTALSETAVGTYRRLADLPLPPPATPTPLPQINSAGCCSPAEQTSCCAPEAKTDCCAPSNEEGCGCR